jgi:hypothetical protein
MPRKLLDLPPAVARKFVADMCAYHAEPNAIKQDEIAARQLHALKPYEARRLRLSDVNSAPSGPPRESRLSSSCDHECPHIAFTGLHI